MEQTSPRTYSINDFREWNEAGTLVLAPKFQRRPVWTDKARSYLIDTVLRNMPMPKIFMRQYLDDAGRTIREMVDGQQRIRTILSYFEGGFPVMQAHGGDEYGGKYYGDLPKEIQEDFLNYSLSVDVLIGATDTDVLGVFARLNTYGVRLNRQELLNAKYFGAFKSAVYQLGYEFYQFWVGNQILTERDIARMLEAELTSELAIAMLSGIQSRKVVAGYYKKYDDEFEERKVVVERFRSCMDLIGEIMDGRLPSSNFSSRHLFYSLFCVVYDLSYGLQGSSIKQIRFNSLTIPRIRNTLTSIDSIFEKEPDEVLRRDREFFDASTKHTTDLATRRTRHNYIVERIIAGLPQVSA